TNSLTRLIQEPRREQNGAAPAEVPPGEAIATVVNGDENGDQRLIEEEGRKLLQSIVEFGDTLVREAMTPRPDMVAISAGAPIAELRTLFQEEEYSRIPVFGENLDNILGLVYVKDLIQLREASESAVLE